jgi:hypothetical protein
MSKLSKDFFSLVMKFKGGLFMEKMDQDMAGELAIEIYDLLRQKFASLGDDGVSDALHALEMVVASIVKMFREDHVDDVLVNFAKNVKFTIEKMSEFSKE